MKTTELVTRDHSILRRGLDIVDGMLRKLEEGQRIEIADITTILTFLRFFGDQYHQSMEDSILFPSLAKSAFDQPAVSQLIAEHHDERALVEQIEEALMSRKVTAFVLTSRRLTAMLRSHFDREDALFARLGPYAMSDRQDEEISTMIANLRKPVEIYTNMSRLERRYLVKPSFELPRVERARA
jgi:hemerythrin-like domain-containing protein